MNDTTAEQARAWVTLLLSGAATREDARDLTHWRSCDVRHEAAFARAARVHGLFRRAAGQAKTVEATSAKRRAPLINRRLLIGGAVAASATGVAVLVGRERLNNGLTADFVTGKGEARSLELAPGVSVELNTLTRIALRPQSGAGAFELLEGEAVVVIDPRSAPLAIRARKGEILSQGGRLALRCLGSEVRVSCLEGAARIRLGDKAVEAPALHSVTYDARGIQPPVGFDGAAEAAWRQGRLVFRNERLGDVVDEINRYRDGRIVIANPVLRDRRVNGVFHTRQINQVVEQIRLAYGVHITRMPGDVVLLA